MSGETLLLWLVVGLIAGWLASEVVGGGYGLVGDIIVGVVGAFIGSAVFRALDVGVPFEGLAGTIFVAFIGACLLLLLLRLVHYGGTHRRGIRGV
ncbi:MAG: GlsB/YeaQ/YmgE family stress response membrane protein [Myxococcota bacterium]